LKDHLSSSRYSRYDLSKNIYKSNENESVKTISNLDKSVIMQTVQTYLPDAPNGRNHDSNVLKIAKVKSKAKDLNN
jgi:hypothetical protein